MKSILVVVVAAILILIAAPHIAATPMKMTLDSHDFNSCQNNAAVPKCCLTADCALSNCNLPNTDDNEVPLHYRSTSKETISPVWSATSATTETSLNPKKPPPREPAQELPSRLCAEYHCRNTLNSEDPL